MVDPLFLHFLRRGFVGMLDLTPSILGPDRFAPSLSGIGELVSLFIADFVMMAMAGREDLFLVM